jgi:elongation factor Ts
MAVTAADVKALRDKTGAGMMDCKKALNEKDGDFEQAVDWLREKGLAAAAKKSGRTAAEGLIAVAVNSDATRAAIVEINSETDFVARNDIFQNAALEIAGIALENDADIEALKATTFSGKPHDVATEVTNLIGVIGENINLRRSAGLEGDVVVSYIHNAVKPNLGKIGVLVALKGDKDKAQEIGKQVAMHIAAIRPESLNVADLDPTLVERERAIFTEQARSSGKPDNIIEKMIEGRIRKYYGEVVLLEQAFVIDGKTPVKQVLKDAGLEITNYIGFTLGEGIEKKNEDFASEVAAAMNG